MVVTPESFSFSDLMSWMENQTGFIANYEDLQGVSLEVPLLLLREEQHYHHGPYCEFAKLNGNQPNCSAFKRNTLEKAAAMKPFESLCPQGIWDWVQPVVFEGEVVGVLYLGSMRTERTLSPINNRIYRGSPVKPITGAMKRQIAEYASYLANTMVIILTQWKTQGHGLSKQKPREFYKKSALMYIRNKYQEDIRLENLANQLRVHPNYLGQTIEQQCGKTFRELLQEYRIEKAKVLLSVGEYSVTETAFGCGFNDSNYFSTVFRKRVGVSPREYRRRSGSPAP